MFQVVRAGGAAADGESISSMPKYREVPQGLRDREHDFEGSRVT